MRRAAQTLALIALVALTGSRAYAQPDQRALQAIPWPSPFDNPDQQLVEARLRAELAIKEGRREDAARARMREAELSRQLGLGREQLSALLEASAQAAGTSLAQSTAISVELAVARANLDARAPRAAWGGAVTAQGALAQPGNEALRQRLEWEVLALKFDTILLVTRAVVARVGDGRPASALEEGVPELLVSILRDVVDIPSLTPDDVAWLDAQRPWLRAVVGKAIQALQEIVDLANGLSGIQRLVVEAHVLARKADLSALAGRWPQAAELREKANVSLEARGQYSDGLRGWIALADDLDALPAGTLSEKARDASLEVLGRVEQNALGMGGQTLDAYLAQYEPQYRRLYRLLRAGEARLDPGAPGPGVSMPMLLQADRMNLRGPRRDLAVYQTLGERLASADLRARFDAREASLREARTAVGKAVAEGQDPDDFPARPLAFGVRREGPFAAYEAAKLALLGALEDIKRRGLGSAERLSMLSLGWSQWLKGMTPTEAVVMYVREPGTDAILAAVITATEPASGQGPDPVIRLSRLDGAGGALRPLVDSLRERVVVGGDPAGALSEISKILWHPLGDLPVNLTILVTPGVLGIPFEALPAGGGRAVIDRHTVRYAFGLQAGLGKYPRPAAYQRALVAGAEDFSRMNLPALPSSRREVETVRALLRDKGVDVAPADALPRSGRALLGAAGPVDVAHLSTHSALDATMPLVDALVFADDELHAYDLAMSAARAGLLVLSACELFGARTHSLYPVSGVVTAALGRIAPQVVSALWAVNAEATELFMRRFYEALLDVREPALALAQAKRDFASPARLTGWMASSGITPPDARRLALYGHPATWAAFVLVVAPLRD